MTPDDSGENVTVQRMLDGDEDAFRDLYRVIQPGLLRYLSVLVGASDAEDVASETWSQAVRDLNRFTGSADGFRGWVTTIGRNRALDMLRSKGRRPVLDIPIEDAPERIDRTTAESEVLVLTSTEEALRLIATLPQDQAEAVLLRAVVGLDAKSAARVLGKTPGAVRTAAYRGLITLRRKLAENQ